MSVKIPTGPIGPSIKQCLSPFAKYNHCYRYIELQKARQTKKHLANMSGSDIARKVVADVSGDDLAKWVRSSTLTSELEEVRQNDFQ